MHNVTYLNFSGCSIASKGIVALAVGFCTNPLISQSLTYLCPPLSLLLPPPPLLPSPFLSSLLGLFLLVFPFIFLLSLFFLCFPSCLSFLIILQLFITLQQQTGTLSLQVAVRLAFHPPQPQLPYAQQYCQQRGA